MSSDDKKINISVDINTLIPLILDSLERGQPVRVVGEGRSMYPFLVGSRDSVSFAPLNGRKPRCGDIFLYRRKNGVYAIHRLYSVDKNGVMCFIGDSQYLLESGILHEQLVAYVPSVLRNGKEVSCEKGMWRFIMTCFMLMRVKHPRFAHRAQCAAYYLVHFFKEPKSVFRWIKRKLHKESV